MVTEIRLYKLKENTADKFYDVFSNQSLPMMKRWKINVVDYGFSLIDKYSFYLIRNYENIEQRKDCQAAFYESDEWKNGPETEIMQCIDTYNTTLIDNEQFIGKLNDKRTTNG
ncbi:MAG: NIPSNAP family protein [Saprospiraceae bacterium]|jgi:hypothetical protein